MTDSCKSRASPKTITTIVLAATLLYGAGHLLWYWQTPFGQAPVLDERENLGWAMRIATGTLPEEPFFRAMLYPLLLAGVFKLGIPASVLPMAGMLLGLGLHLLNTLLAVRIAATLFRSSVAGLATGILHGLNPVLLHYATQLLDNTLANTFVLLGVLALARPARDDRTDDDLATAMLAAAGWTLAALARPQLLMLLPSLPLLWLLLRRSGPRGQWRNLLTITLTAGALLSAQGLWQRSVSGSLNVLPAQAAYNLWSANRPGADGRYFTQTVRMTAKDIHTNPAGEEAVLLFVRETGRPPASPDEVNRHWQTRLREHVVGNPAGWLGLMARKTYYLFNDFEPYNNKTYAFHQARSPWLAPNPIGWGLLLTASLAGATILIRGNPRGALLILTTFGVLAAGILLTYVSGRFRLPLTALLCVLGGGLPFAAGLACKTRLLLAGSMLCAAMVTFSDFAGARDTKTFLQDNLLLAASALESGDDETAWDASAEALARAPSHPDAKANLLTAGFNLLLADRLTTEREAVWRQNAGEVATGLAHEPQVPMVAAIAGLALWRGGKQDVALSLWKQQARATDGDPSADALALALRSAGKPAPALQDTNPDNAFALMLLAVTAPSDSNHDLRLLAGRLFAGKPISNFQ